jgi:hypothetical protein
MVRMSDLARGGAPAPPAKPASPPPAPANPPPTTPAPAPPPANPTARVADAPVPPPRRGSASSSEAQASAEQAFEDLRSFLDRVPALLETGAGFPWSGLTRIIGHVIQLLEGGGELFWLANGGPPPRDGDPLALHQARVTVLAIRIGMTMGYERDRLVELGLAAALSGIGLWQLPDGLLPRLDSLSGEERAQYHAHPRVAAELVRRWGAPFEGLAQTVLQHQEREQGQGFPQGLQGAAIRLEAKIVGLADAYISLLAPFTSRPGLRPHEAVREIVRGRQEAFPAVLVKALLSDVTVFPPGTMVRLNTGETGAVMAVNRNHPLRPRVEVISSRVGLLATPKTVDLSEAPFLYITGPVAETAR